MWVCPADEHILGYASVYVNGNKSHIYIYFHISCITASGWWWCAGWWHDGVLDGGHDGGMMVA